MFVMNTQSQTEVNMFKKAVSIMLVICLLAVSMPAASANTQNTTSRTIDEILDEYHTKSFDAKCYEDDAATSKSRSYNNSTSTLEQETVDALNAAGYEAYNVTASNYESLEDQLQTDFTELGLDPNSSYIIAIGGEPPSYSTDSSSSRSKPPLEEDLEGDESPDSSYIFHSDDGHSYRVRQITVTSADDSQYEQQDDADILNTSMSADFVERILNYLITTWIDDSYDTPWGTIIDLLGIDIVSIDINRGATLHFFGGVDRTRIFTQIFTNNASYPSGGTWATYYSVERARVFTQFYCMYYDRSINGHNSMTTTPNIKYLYSTNYLYPTNQNENAVYQYNFSQSSGREIVGNLYIYVTDKNYNILPDCPYLSFPQYIGDLP